MNFGSHDQAPGHGPEHHDARSGRSGRRHAERVDATSRRSSVTFPRMILAIPGVPTFWVYNDDDTTVSEDTGVVGPIDNGGGSTDPSDLGSSTTYVTPPPDGGLPTDGQVITVGEVTGLGDALMINDQAARELDLGIAANMAPWSPLLPPKGPITMFRPAPHGPNTSNRDDATGFLRG